MIPTFKPPWKVLRDLRKAREQRAEWLRVINRQRTLKRNLIASIDELRKYPTEK